MLARWLTASWTDISNRLALVRNTYRAKFNDCAQGLRMANARRLDLSEDRLIASRAIVDM